MRVCGLPRSPQAASAGHPQSMGRLNVLKTGIHSVSGRSFAHSASEPLTQVAIIARPVVQTATTVNINV